MIKKMRRLFVRFLDHYTTSHNRDSIEYWLSRTFHGVALSGLGLGFLALIPGMIIFFLKANERAMLGYLVLFTVICSTILNPKLSVKVKATVTSSVLFLAGVAALLLGGPAGQRGLGFTAAVIVCSLYVGFRASLVFAGLGLIIGMTFAVLSGHGFKGWIEYPEFPFGAWVLQSIDIFVIDLMLAIATAILIRGMGASFKALVAAEAKDRASLAEKETLIRELYHRTKNNMQVVSSMLKLHSRELESQADALIFKDVTNKIIAMSLVHQKLYESQDLSNIDAADYVRELVPLLANSYGLPKGQIQVVLDIEELKLLIDTAVPLGILISEIMANSLKHAFPDGRKGRITIVLKSEGEYILLKIADDGIGLPPGFQVASDGRMGMKTLFTIVEHQLQGSIGFGSENGLSYEIRIKGKLYDERVNQPKG